MVKPRKRGNWTRLRRRAHSPRQPGPKAMIDNPTTHWSNGYETTTRAQAHHNIQILESHHILPHPQCRHLKRTHYPRNYRNLTYSARKSCGATSRTSAPANDMALMTLMPLTHIHVTPFFLYVTSSASRTAVGYRHRRLFSSFDFTPITATWTCLYLKVLEIPHF